MIRAGILLGGLILLSHKLTGWFVGHHEWNSAMHGLFARNQLRFGLGYTKLFSIWNLGADPTGEALRYLHHPPLLSIWGALSMSLLGIHEWALRLVAIISTLGSALLLMAIVSRLASRPRAWATGGFFLMLPVTAYFGRMFDHVAPVQFLSLLMLHGYLAWSGDYADGRRQPRGALWYTVGAVLGIGTGWAAWILAALIAGWHVLRRRRGRPIMIGVIAIPVATMLAVWLHLLWGNGWQVTLFTGLLRSRVAGSIAEEGIENTGWWVTQGRYLSSNFTLIGIFAGLLFPVLAWARPRPGAAEGEEGTARTSIHTVLAILLLQGVLYVVLFPRQSLIHDYWQIFAAPYVAFSLGSLLVMFHGIIKRRRPRAAAAATILGILAVLAPALRSLHRLHQGRQISPHYVEAYLGLRKYLPPLAPIMVSRDWYGGGHGTGQDSRRWPHPQIAYYADRPMYYSVDIAEIIRNPNRCAAYVLEFEETDEVRRLFDGLVGRYDHVSVKGHHMVFLLDPQSRTSPDPVRPDSESNTSP